MKRESAGRSERLPTLAAAAGKTKSEDQMAGDGGILHFHG